MLFEYIIQRDPNSKSKIEIFLDKLRQLERYVHCRFDDKESYRNIDFLKYDIRKKYRVIIEKYNNEDVGSSGIVKDAYHRFQEFYSGVLRFIKHHEVKLDNISFDELETDVFFFVPKREQNY